ncbi:Peroxidase 47 [Hibiscus syriacus]|uniref:peroxidase n=1 Tax=Hibiscus syriacus TaxID=106335 RepID=A0A6A2ZUK8_HIBSY|nr:Peroxidase 47 [Hibiscus syriacus]
MAMATLLVMLIVIGSANSLRMDYYITTFPFAESIVKNAVNKALQNDPSLAAALLRMHFHDCFVEGCDGSVLVDSTEDNTAEKDSPANLSLRGFEVIDDAKEQLEEQCPGIASCADIVAMAAGDAIFWLINAFGRRGFTTTDMVALSGAHTLGVARCSSFKNRLSNQDPTLDSDFAKALSKTCGAGDNAEQSFDDTPKNFDNDYFNALTRKNGVLFSDQVLYTATGTRAIVNGYVMNEARFFLDFQQSMVKMGRLDVKEGPKGEVRKNCRKIN